MKFAIPLAVALLTCIPLAQVEFSLTHELLSPVIRLHEMHHVMTQNGRVMVPWSPDLAFGHGLPFFIYYAPLATYVAEVPHLLGADLLQAIKVSYALSLVLSAASMALLLSYLSKSYRFPASPLTIALASAAYVTAPYRMVDVYVRGSLAECWSFVWFPLILLGCHMLADERWRKGLVIGSLSYAALILSHNIMALYFTVVLCVYAIAVREVRRQLVRAAIMMALGQALSAFFWVPALANMPLVGTEPVTMWATAKDIASHAVYWPQFFSRGWEFGLSVPGPDDGMSFAIGWHIIAAVVLLPCVIFNRKERASSQRLALVVLILTVILVAAMTRIMPWNLVPHLFRYIQFPWRLLAFTTLFGSVAVFFALNGLRRWSGVGSDNRLQAVFHVSLLLLILMLAGQIVKASSFRPGKVDRQYILERLELEESTGYIGTTARSEYVPATAAEETLDPDWNEEHYSESHAEIVDGSAAVTDWTSRGARYTMDVQCNTDTTLAFQSFYFPGWRHWRDGVRRDDEMKLGDAGFIHVTLPAGKHHLVFEYGFPPWGRASQLVSGAAALGMLVWLFRCRLQQRPRLDIDRP